MTNPSSTDLIYRTGFEVHKTDEGLYWLGETYQGDHCAPTDRLSEDMTADELRRRFESYIATGRTQTAKEHMRSLFDNEFAHWDGLSSKPMTQRLDPGDWMLEITIGLQTGEDFLAYASMQPSDGSPSTEEDAMESAAELVTRRIYSLEVRNPDPDHAEFPKPFIADIKRFVIAKGYTMERSFKVECNIAVPFGEPIPEFKELTPEEQRIPPGLLSSMPW